MLIGEDFEKIQFEMFGLDLLEPNVFLTDTLIFIVAVILAFRIKRFGLDTPFKKNWYWFFMVFGFGFFVGGFGHLLFSYFGIPGKFPALYLGIFSAIFIERAMISLHPSETLRNVVHKLIYVKLVVALVAATLVFIYADLVENPSRALTVTTINAVAGSIFALVYLGLRYAKSITPSFHYFWIAVLPMILTGIIQSSKINLHPWFDRNDLSHLLIILNIILYFYGIRGYVNRVNS